MPPFMQKKMDEMMAEKGKKAPKPVKKGKK